MANVAADSDLNLLSAFLARRDLSELAPSQFPDKADVIVLLGSSVLESVAVAAAAFHAGVAPCILISGGIGHSSPFLWQKVGRSDVAEAIVFRDLLNGEYGVPADAILVESTSTNCGANAWESKRLLGRREIEARRIVLIQDPTMQRRTHASFERAWQDSPETEFISFAPFVPVWRDGMVTPSAWSPDRFLDLVLGEYPRFDAYGPSGTDYIAQVAVPANVRAAYARVSKAFASHRKDLSIPPSR